MANEKTTKGKNTRAATPVVSTNVEESVVASDTANKPVVAKEIDPNQIVTVRNGFHGTLVYKSKRTGERWVWDEFGAEQEMELSELKSAKNSSKKYFIENWFMFDEAWIIDYLGVKMFYKNALSIEEFDDLFSKPADEVERIVSNLSAGQKKSVAYRARQMIAAQEIDSNRVINTLERCLGVELIER